MSDKQDTMRAYLPEYYNDVTEMQTIIDCEYPEFENIETSVGTIKTEIYIDTAVDEGLSRLEAIFNIDVTTITTIEQRRSVIKSKLRGQNKLNTETIKNVCLSFNNGDVDVIKYPSGSFTIKFVSNGGIPQNLTDLKTTIEQIKPAHMGVIYDFQYMTWDVLDAKNITWDELDALNLSWDVFETGIF